MFIDKETHVRVNVHAPYKGFSRLDTPEIRERAGVVEIPEPPVPEDYSEKLYYRTEQDTMPYVVYTRKSDEQIAAMQAAEAEQEALRYLAETDWYVVRFAETGREIPVEVLQKRAECRNIV